MTRLSLQRPFAIVLFAIALLALALPTQAAERPYSSRGTAQFISPTDFVGTGNATHLGLYDEVGSVEFSPTDDPTILQLDADATYTAANGDQLHAIFTGHLDGLTGVVTATVTYVGGTGRFAHATGTASLTGQLHPDGSIDVRVRGTIDY